MPESGGDLRRRRTGDRGLLQRRQQARSRMGTQSDSRTAADRGDVCQLGSTSPESSKFSFWNWDWFRGKSTRSRRRSLHSDDTRPESKLGLDRRPGSSPTVKTQSDGVGRSVPPTRSGSVSSNPLPYRPQVSRQPLSRSSRSSKLSQVPQRPDRSLTTPRLSSERRSQRSERDRRSTPTRLQANQPTLIQASTSLQQNTALQDQTTLTARRASRSRKRPPRAVRPQSRSLAIALYAARMLILSVGVGVLAGTVLSAWNPSVHSVLGERHKELKQANSIGGKVEQPGVAATQLSLAQELTPVKTAIQGVAKQYPAFAPGVFLIDLDTNNFMDWSGSATFSAASTIKVPILIAFFQDIDAGKIRLDEKLTMRKELIATEAGDMQFLPVGSQFTALETATKMITISDNTATNMVIDRLGGIQALNQRFKSWGLTTTQLTNLLPDLKGTNTTSPKELASLMVRVSQGELVSLRSRDRLLDIMRRTINNSQLPQGLGEGAVIAHKTGDIAGVIGDVGLIDMPSGKRYATAVLIRRTPNDDAAYDLVQKISRAMYQHFAQTAGSQRSTSTTPAPTTPPQPDAEPDAANTDAQYSPEQLPHTPEIDPTQAAHR